MELDARTIGAGIFGVLGALALVQTLRLAWRAGARRWTLARRFARARRGESDAEALLARAGYRVLARQARASLTYVVDGTPRAARVVADLLVERGGRRFVAEVKTGERAPDPLGRATRRQLLEYAHAFEAEGLLLVDADAGAVREVATPRRHAPSARWAWLLAGVAVGWALATLLA
ncbi:MAG: hypothetical protein KF729_35115 [Sandaracinaceae bacterium]|nr:hypothetical protein [Sandaracinaceae bacterium]